VNGELSCQEMIEVVTDYLDDALAPGERERFERHLSYCRGCVTYTEQMRETIRQTGRVPHDEPLSPALRERILGEFRSWCNAAGESPDGTRDA
jgi:anti-sigma factor RsiW